MRVDSGGLQQFARGVHHRNLNAGAQAGVKSQCRPSAGGCGQQQIAQIMGEHSDRFFFGGFAQALFQFSLQMRQ